MATWCMDAQNGIKAASLRDKFSGSSVVGVRQCVTERDKKNSKS